MILGHNLYLFLKTELIFFHLVLLFISLTFLMWFDDKMITNQWINIKIVYVLRDERLFC